jgi:predicted ferric reductase
MWLWFDYQNDPTHSYLALMSINLVKLVPASLKDFYAEQAHLMGLPLTAQTSAYWYMARIGGIVSYLLLWLSTIWGLLLSTKLIPKWVSTIFIYGLHEFLALLALVFMTLHVLILLGDEYVNFNIFHLLIPFNAPYEPFWTGLGVTAFYLSAVLTGSFYVRRQIGQKAWRTLHYLTFVAYTLALGHGMMAGTDSSSFPMKLTYLITASLILFLFYYRLFSLKILTTK